ncbi:unnamed protein product [Tuber aestivum]|uniref:Uncharacterized protein n=1 Tax=Tuber aestivum TaxID=59557 RepID=A0A292PQ32_9PEZI|nr:unnamed protein product [Tuber aestivum]
MPRYRKLPPISRTPTPPPDFLRRLRPFSCNPFEPVEEDGQDRDDGDDEDVNAAPTNFTSHSFPLIKGGREPKKQYLPVGKHPAGRSKRQRLEKQPQIEEDSPDIVLENESVLEWDALGSIFVAGGFLMMGNGFGGSGVEEDEAGEPDGENSPGPGTEQAMNDTRSAVTGSGGEDNIQGMGGETMGSLQSSEARATAKPSQRPNARHSYNINPIVKGHPLTATPFGPKESSQVLDVANCNTGELVSSGTGTHDNCGTGPGGPNPTASSAEPAGDGRDFRDTREHAQLTVPLPLDDKGKSAKKATSPTSAETEVGKQTVRPMVESVVPPTALANSGPRELPSGNTEPKKRAEGDEWLKGLTFEILALPERIVTNIRGRDFFDSRSHKLCWDELKEKIDQGLGIGPNLRHSTVIVNWKFRLKTQADLDICIERLTPHGRPIHHVVVLFCSTDSSASANTGVKIDEESITKQVVELLEAQDRNYWMGKSVTPSVTDLVPASKDINAGVVWGKLPGEAQDSIRRNFGNPQLALLRPPAPLSENPTTPNPTQSSILHKLIPGIPIAPKPPLWRTPNSPSTSRSETIGTAVAGTQLHPSSRARQVTPEQLSGQIMAPGNKSGNKADNSPAPPNTNGAPTPAATKWRSKPSARNSSPQVSASFPHNLARGGGVQVQRNTRSNSKATKLGLLDQPQKGSEASEPSDQTSAGAASANIQRSSPKRRASTGRSSRAKKRLAKSTNPAGNPQALTSHDQQSSSNAFSASMGPPSQDQASMATSKALATACGLAGDDHLEPSSVNDTMDMDPPTTNSAKVGAQDAEPNDLSINEGNAMDKANAGNAVYAMDEVDILLKAVMDVYNSTEKQSVPQSMKSLTPSADRPGEGDSANRGNAPAVLVKTALPNGTEGGISARGSKSLIVGPTPVEAPSSPPPSQSPAPVVGEPRPEIRTDKGAGPATTTKPQSSALRSSEGSGVITGKRSLIVKLKTKGTAVPFPPITNSDATNRPHETPDQGPDQAPDHPPNQPKPKPVWPVPPPPLSASPPAMKVPPAPRPPIYRKPDPPVSKPTESAKAAVNDKPRASEQAIPTATPSPKPGSLSKNPSPEPSGSLVAGSDALAAARKKIEQEKGLKSKTKNATSNALPTPILPPRYQDTRTQSLQSQPPETSSARPSLRPSTPCTNSQFAVHKPASYTRPSPSSDTKSASTSGVTKSSLHREAVPLPRAVPGPPDMPAPTLTIPPPPPTSMAISPSGNTDNIRWIQGKAKDATVNAVASPPFHKATKSAPEEPCLKFTPLVSKSNFLYFEPPAVRKSPGDSHEKQPTTQDLVPLFDSPSTNPSDTKPKPERMVFTVARYKNNATTPPHSAEFYGHEILLTGESNKFSWEKLRGILESRHKFVDFKECLVINLFHVVESEKDLNEGLNLGVYLNINDVLIVKVDPLGRLPPPLVAEMKAARLAARKAGKETE